MTLAISEPAFDENRLLCEEHLTFDSVPWSHYEAVLDQIGNGAIRVTYHEGRMEIMAPLPEHDAGKRAIGCLIDVLTIELNIPTSRFGSTTFRREDNASGLEPDECYYLQNESRVRGMKRFDLAIHPAPDLAIEVDISARSIAREPVYAALGVPELWRYDGLRLAVLLLDRASGTYRPSPTSGAFPFLRMDDFVKWVHRMEQEEQTAMLRDFQAWTRTLSRYPT